MPDQLAGARKFLSAFSGAFRPERLARLGGVPLVVPVYHTVSDKHLPHISPLYTARTTDLFRDDLEFFLKHFRAVELNDLMGQKDPTRDFDGPVFHITFDDGLSEFYHTAWPMLQEHGIAATMFINPAFLDNKELFYRHKVALLLDKLDMLNDRPAQEIVDILRAELPMCSDDPVKALTQVDHSHRGILDEVARLLDVDFDLYLQEHKPYLTTEQVLSMIEDGLTVGGHSIDHPLYSQLPESEQLRQTQDSVSYVQQTFGTRYRAFAFPYTDDGVEASFFEQAHNGMLDISFGTAGIKHEQWAKHIHRIPMELGDATAEDIIGSEYLYYLLKQPFGKNTLTRQ